MSLADNVRMVITIRVGIDSTVRPHPALNANNLQPLFAPNEHRDRQYTVKNIRISTDILWRVFHTF